MKKKIIIGSILFLVAIGIIILGFLTTNTKNVNPPRQEPTPTETATPNPKQDKPQIDQNLRKVINNTNDFQSLITNDFKDREQENIRGSDQKIPSEYNTTVDNIVLKDTVVSGATATVVAEITTTTVNVNTNFQTRARETYEYTLKFEDNIWKVDDINLLNSESL